MSNEEQKRRRQRREEEGFTLIEIMIVIVIIGLIGTGVAYNFVGQMSKANTETASTETCKIRSVVTLYRAQNPGNCPTMDDLKNGYLDSKQRTVDPWQQPYVIECDGGDVEVYSLGEDGNGHVGCGDGEQEE